MDSFVMIVNVEMAQAWTLAPFGGTDLVKNNEEK